MSFSPEQSQQESGLREKEILDKDKQAEKDLEELKDISLGATQDSFTLQKTRDQLDAIVSHNPQPDERETIKNYQDEIKELENQIQKRKKELQLKLTNYYMGKSPNSRTSEEMTILSDLLSVKIEDMRNDPAITQGELNGWLNKKMRYDNTDIVQNAKAIVGDKINKLRKDYGIPEELIQAA